MVDIVRNPKGTAPSKVSGTTLTHADVFVKAGQALYVGVGYDTGQGAPEIKWGNRVLTQEPVRSQSGMAVALYLLRHVNEDRTRDIVCTWGGAIVAKAMLVGTVDGVKIQDVSAGASEASTVDPTTGSAVTSTQPDTIQISIMGSRGPVSDTPGTVADGHTSGQRVGTSGAPPTSNITIHETYKILSATGDVRASKTGATARTWANVIFAIKQSIRHRQGITPSDLLDVEAVFETANVDFNDVIFKFNTATDLWEAYETTTPGTLRATRSKAGTWS